MHTSCMRASLTFASVSLTHMGESVHVGHKSGCAPIDNAPILQMLSNNVILSSHEPILCWISFLVFFVLSYHILHIFIFVGYCWCWYVFKDDFFLSFKSCCFYSHMRLSWRVCVGGGVLMDCAVSLSSAPFMLKPPVGAFSASSAPFTLNILRSANSRSLWGFSQTSQALEIVGDQDNSQFRILEQGCALHGIYVVLKIQCTYILWELHTGCFFFTVPGQKVLSVEKSRTKKGKRGQLSLFCLCNLQHWELFGRDQ